MAPQKAHYRLTPHGRTLGPVFESLWAWGVTHLAHLEDEETAPAKSKSQSKVVSTQILTHWLVGLHYTAMRSLAVRPLRLVRLTRRHGGKRCTLTGLLRNSSYLVAQRLPIVTIPMVDGARAIQFVSRC